MMKKKHICTVCEKSNQKPSCTFIKPLCKKISFILLSLSLVIILSSCDNQSNTNESESESLSSITSDSSSSYESAVEPEVVDPFMVEDNVVDSTNDIVIDIYSFINGRNSEHKGYVDKTYTKEFFETCAPDFYDTLDLVSKEEADALLNSEEKSLSSVCTKEQAIDDVDLLFRVLKSFYGPYYYFGGDETFGAAEENIIEEINNFSHPLTGNSLVDIISKNLYFVEDRHMNIGPDLLCEYNDIAAHDFYVKDLFFYEDDIGFYTKIYDRKWYLDSVGSDNNIGDYLKITIDQNGQLCYMLGLAITRNDDRLNIKGITLLRGENEAFLPITWQEFSSRNNANTEISETITINDNIPLIEINFWRGADSEFDKQSERTKKLGKPLLKQDVFIIDANSGCGWQSLFDSINHESNSISLYKLSNTANFLGRWNMPWHEGKLGEYYVRISSGRWGRNDTLVFAVQDKNNFSAAEDTIADIRAIENIILVGGSTGGTAGPSGGTNQYMILPNTGLYIHFGASFMIDSGYNEDTFCFEPDIWVNPTDAVDAIYRLCQFYGIENTADTSILNAEQ